MFTDEKILWIKTITLYRRARSIEERYNEVPICVDIRWRSKSLSVLLITLPELDCKVTVVSIMHQVF